jgi:hypothetical protein
MPRFGAFDTGSPESLISEYTRAVRVVRAREAGASNDSALWLIQRRAESDDPDYNAIELEKFYSAALDQRIVAINCPEAVAPVVGDPFRDESTAGFAIRAGHSLLHRQILGPRVDDAAARDMLFATLQSLLRLVEHSERGHGRLGVPHSVVLSKATGDWSASFICLDLIEDGSVSPRETIARHLAVDLQDLAGLVGQFVFRGTTTAPSKERWIRARPELGARWWEIADALRTRARSQPGAL